MTSRLWKNHLIIPSSTLRWNRPEQTLLWTIVVLAVSVPCLLAGEEETARSRRNRIRWVAAEETAPSEEAVARWNQLKSRYDYREAAPPLPESPRSRHPQAPIRPIPEEEDSGDAWLAEESPRPTDKAASTNPVPLAAEPLPIGKVDEEPAWIYGTTAEAVDAKELVLKDDAPPVPEPVPEAPESPATQPLIVSPAKPEDPGYARTTGSRHSRTIHEISPTYDRTSDQDIRDFAKQQLRQYQIEISRGVYPQRNFPGLIYQWEPSNFYHYPLYFEDPAFERYGHTYGDFLQPFASIIRFGVQTVGLPYQMTIDPICCPKYALGWYRPGECAPKLHYQIPLNAKAAAVEAGVITGLFFAIP